MNDNHRSLGRDLGLFDTTPAVGAGLPLWLPDGAVIRAELERLALEEALASGCRRVYTPVLAKRELFERSGHWEKFAEDMFPPMVVGGEEFVLRPANCPHHTQVYAATPRSYRDLPVRLAEIGSMFRSELSGVLGGLSRVRQINLDDAHSFCREDQVVDEVVIALRAIARCYEVLGIDIAEYRLSRRGVGPGYVGDDAVWERSEAMLRDALDVVGVAFREAPGEAAFYGPKIDVQVLDASGRGETLSTVQIDYNQPARFGLSYVDRDGSQRTPVMVHRGLLSSMERMTALLIERYAGRLPTWLAPTQVWVLPVSEEGHGGAARAVADRLGAAGVRCLVADRGTLGARIRAARDSRVPYYGVIGDAEVASSSLAVSAPGIGTAATLAVDHFIDHLVEEIGSRRRTPAAVQEVPPVSGGGVRP